MFTPLFYKILATLAVPGLAILGYLGVATTADVHQLHQRIDNQDSQIQQLSVQPMIGASIPIVVSRFETSLQSSISDSATSITLVSGTDRAGNALVGFHCFTIDEGTSVAEDVCGTASGTAVSSLTRGISPVTGTSSVSSLKFSHRRGASVKITDYPQLAVLSRILNGNETIPNQLVFDDSVASSTMGGALQNVASVAYVNSVAVSGAADASTIVKGIAEAATVAEVAAGTALGGTAALLFAPNSLYSQTATSSTAIPVTNSSGKLAQGFLDLTQSFTWSGAHTFNSATTTLSATSSIAASANSRLFLNAVPYTFPSSQGAASTTLVNNGSGVLNWYNVGDTLLTTSGVAATSTASTMTIPHGLGKVPKYVRITAFGMGGACGNAMSVGTYNGAATNTVYRNIDGACGTGDGGTDTTNIVYLKNNSAVDTATIAVNSTNIVLTWTFGSSDTAAILWEAY